MSKEQEMPRSAQIERFARAISIASSLHALNLSEFDDNDADQVPPKVYDMALRIVGLGYFADRRAERLAEYNQLHPEFAQNHTQAAESVRPDQTQV